MELIQQVEIPAAVPQVWQALNDPEVLKQSLTGCESFTENASGGYDIVLLAKVGPVKARFAGEVTLSDIVEERSYTLSGGGKGGIAGHAKGSASVSLIALENGHTTMRYSVNASVGGKIAQLGSRLVDGAARKMAKEFFTKFIRVLCKDESIEVTLETITG